MCELLTGTGVPTVWGWEDWGLRACCCWPGGTGQGELRRDPRPGSPPYCSGPAPQVLLLGTWWGLWGREEASHPSLPAAGGDVATVPPPGQLYWPLWLR